MYNNAVRGQKQRVAGSRGRSIIIIVSSRRLDLVGSIDPVAIYVHRSRQVCGSKAIISTDEHMRVMQLGVKLTVDVRLIRDTADFTAEMPDVVFVVELATDSLGVVAEQTVEHGVCHQHTIRISIPPARIGC